MLRRKTDIVVGLTTFNTEMLKISVSALARIRPRFTLIIHNDNPNVRLTARDIRAMGYRGTLHIINSVKTRGPRAARMQIIDITRRYVNDARWIIYVDDDDILLNVDVPDVSDMVFAVIQNALLVNTRVSDLMMAATHPDTIMPDKINISVQQPHIGIRGTAIRIKHMTELADIINTDTETKLAEIDDSLAYRAPIDAMMWMALNMLMRYRHPECAPIFMDSTNYIQNNIDFGAVKYGRPGTTDKNHAAHLDHAMARYARVIQTAINAQ
ncbi:hypothetical protein HDR61_04415 [bacterium]|nr:hypothetical protein [bacterium]